MYSVCIVCIVCDMYLSVYSVCIDVPDIPDDPAHPSVQLIHDHYSNPVEAPLEECLEWHTKQEKVLVINSSYINIGY